MVAADECAQALVILAARRATGQMRTQAGNSRVRIGSAELELDVAIELREALVTTDLALIRPEQSLEHLFWIESFHHSSFSFVSAIKPAAARCRRSLARASCRGL